MSALLDTLCMHLLPVYKLAPIFQIYSKGQSRMHWWIYLIKFFIRCQRLVTQKKDPYDFCTMAHVVDLKAIQDAYARLSSFLHLTPVLTSTTVDEKIGRKVFFKAESFQKTGAFKIRGALNAVSKKYVRSFSKNVHSCRFYRSNRPIPI